jgi:hypothetical protein
MLLHAAHPIAIRVSHATEQQPASIVPAVLIGTNDFSATFRRMLIKECLSTEAHKSQLSKWAKVKISKENRTTAKPKM